MPNSSAVCAWVRAVGSTEKPPHSVVWRSHPDEWAEWKGLPCGSYVERRAGSDAHVAAGILDAADGKDARDRKRKRKDVTTRGIRGRRQRFDGEPAAVAQNQVLRHQ